MMTVLGAISGGQLEDANGVGAVLGSSRFMNAARSYPHANAVARKRAFSNSANMASNTNRPEVNNSCPGPGGACCVLTDRHTTIPSPASHAITNGPIR